MGVPENLNVADPGEACDFEPGGSGAGVPGSIGVADPERNVMQSRGTGLYGGKSRCALCI